MQDVIFKINKKNKIERNDTPDLLNRSLEDLSFFYNPISLFKEVVDKKCSENVENCFQNYQPIPLYNRAPNHIFLHVYYNLKTGEMESLHHLSTPFGEVRILGSGDPEKIKETASILFKETDWDLEDVTEEIEDYDYKQESNYSYGPLRKNFDYWDDQTQKKTFLVKRIGNIKLPTARPLISVSNPSIIESEVSGYDQFSKEKQKFRIISLGSSTFTPNNKKTPTFKTSTLEELEIKKIN